MPFFAPPQTRMLSGQGFSPAIHSSHSKWHTSHSRKFLKSYKFRENSKTISLHIHEAEVNSCSQKHKVSQVAHTVTAGQRFFFSRSYFFQKSQTSITVSTQIALTEDQQFFAPTGTGKNWFTSSSFVYHETLYFGTALGCSVHLSSKKRIQLNLPVVIVIVIYNSFREANEVAFLLSTRGDRDASTGWGLRLTSQFCSLSPSALTLLNKSKPSHQPKPLLGSYHQLLLSSWLYNHLLPVPSSPHTQPCHSAFPALIGPAQTAVGGMKEMRRGGELRVKEKKRSPTLCCCL